MNKVETIIKEEFDERVALMALAYTLGQLGMDNASEITDDEIEAMDGNPMMSKESIQSLAKCARRIGKECDFVKDVVPYIVENFQYLTEGKCE